MLCMLMIRMRVALGHCTCPRTTGEVSLVIPVTISSVLQWLGSFSLDIHQE